MRAGSSMAHTVTATVAVADGKDQASSVACTER